MSMVPPDTYWKSSGKFEGLNSALDALIPRFGSVDKPHKNKALERLRKARKAYYQLYNNGLCNGAQSFARLFRIAPRQYLTNVRHGTFAYVMYVETEREMDKIILAAGIEQGLCDDELHAVMKY